MGSGGAGGVARSTRTASARLGAAPPAASRSGVPPFFASPGSASVVVGWGKPYLCPDEDRAGVGSSSLLPFRSQRTVAPPPRPVRHPLASRSSSPLSSIRLLSSKQSRRRLPAPLGRRHPGPSSVLQGDSGGAFASPPVVLPWAPGFGRGRVSRRLTSRILGVGICILPFLRGSSRIRRALAHARAPSALLALPVDTPSSSFWFYPGSSSASSPAPLSSLLWFSTLVSSLSPPIVPRSTGSFPRSSAPPPPPSGTIRISGVFLRLQTPSYRELGSAKAFRRLC